MPTLLSPIEIGRLQLRNRIVMPAMHLLYTPEGEVNDRLIALRFGAAAVRALDEGQQGVMVALDPPTVKYVPLADATKRMKNVPLDCDIMLTARNLGMCFGD